MNVKAHVCPASFQAQMFENLKDSSSQRDLQAVMWGVMDQIVKRLPMAHVLRLNDRDLTMLAIDISLCKDSYKLKAFLQAYRGLFW